MFGLQIGEHVIKKITGPSSYSILIPPENSSLPIQFLLGDIHRSMNNHCEDEKGVYTIHEEELLGIFDELAKTYPIYFYTESAEGSFMEETGNPNQEDGFLFSRLLGYIKNCYGNKNRLDYTCPTTYMKWVHSDARYFERSIEGYLCNYFRKFVSKQSEKQDDLLFNWNNIFRENYSYKYCESISLSIVLVWLNTILEASKKVPEKKTRNSSRVEDGIKIGNLSQNSIVYEDELGEIYMKSSGIIDHYESFLERMINVYLFSINETDSSVKRQLDRVNIDPIGIMKKGFDTRLFNILYSLKDDIPAIKIIISLVDKWPDSNEGQANYYLEIVQRFSLLDEVDPFRKLKSCMDKINIVFVYLTSPIIDLFYISRMLRTPSFLNIVYFGDRHVQNIRNYLIDSLGYAQVSSYSISPNIRYDKASRCIEITKSINLDVILSSYRNNRTQLLLEYHNSINKESSDREESSTKAGILDKIRLKITPLKPKVQLPEFLLFLP